MQVSIIIPNYNGKQYIKECLDALTHQTYTNYEVLFVDNGSLDGSRSYMKENYPHIQMIPLDKNYGFSYAVNVGIRASTAEYVVLLNNDTAVEPSWLESLVRCIQSDPQIFSCSSKMIRYHERHLIDDAGDEYCILGWAYKRGDGQPLERYNQTREVFSACAGAAIYRRSIFKEIGYFEESFFAYLEDVDISYRARIYGYKNLYCSDALVYHIGSATTGATKYNSFKVKLAARNNIYLAYKNMPTLQRWVNKPFLSLGWLIKYMFFIKKGYREEYMAGTREARATIKDIQRVPYQKRHFKNYIKIQGLLVGNTWGYIRAKMMDR
ncbi:MAG TPA: glycosyltransferase family 2 protein [Epulopiscium sp.]|nr:glycosyltransferase family 2 protein [Candidatus Epulonipiscium sp.]